MRTEVKEAYIKQAQADTRSVMIAAMHDHDIEIVYPLLMACWRCGHESWGWLSSGLFDYTTGDESLAVRVAQRLREAPGGRLRSVARFGEVTTKAGGTYSGFTCNRCSAVHGRHFMQLQLAEHLADGTARSFELSY